MAFLLLFHEKLRLKREVNELTLKQAQRGNKIKRVQKKIESEQKRYGSIIANIDKQAQMCNSSGKVSIMQSFGLSPMAMSNPMGSSMSGYVMNQVGTFLTEKYGKDKKGQEKIQAMLMEYQANGLKQKVDDKNKLIDNQYGSEGQFTKEEVDNFYKAMNAARMNQEYAQFAAQQKTTEYQNNVSIWQEYNKAAIEAEQDAVLAPLSALQTELEIENDSIAAQLEYAKARLQNLDQAVGEGIKDAAPKFGLG